MGCFHLCLMHPLLAALDGAKWSLLGDLTFKKTKQLPKYMRPYFICIYLNVVIAQYLNKFSIWPSLSYYTPQINKYLIEIH